MQVQHQPLLPDNWLELMSAISIPTYTIVPRALEGTHVAGVGEEYLIRDLEYRDSAWISRVFHRVLCLSRAAQRGIGEGRYRLWMGRGMRRCLGG